MAEFQKDPLNDSTFKHFLESWYHAPRLSWPMCLECELSLESAQPMEKKVDLHWEWWSGVQVDYTGILFWKVASTDIKISSLLIRGFNITGAKNVNENHGTLVAKLMTKRKSLRLQVYLPLGISELAGGANWQESLWKWLSFSSSLCYFN